MKGNNGIKLYNAMFPIWMLWLFPIAWVFILPITFITDSAVFLIALKCLKQKEIMQKYKAAVLKVWLLGFVADIPGLLMMFTPQLFPYSQTGFLNWWYENVENAVAFNPFSNIVSLLYVLIAVGIPFALIYFLNFNVSLKRMDMGVKEKKRLALSLAIFTTPWLFLFPSGLLYK